MVRAYPRLYQPKTSLTNWAYGFVIFGGNTRSGQTILTGSTLRLRQTLNQTTIIIVIYTHIDLGENKYQNIGGYGNTLGLTNPKPLSKTGRTGT